MLWLMLALAWLEASAIADWVGGPIYPVISALHILAICFVIAPVMLADVRAIRIREMDNRAKDLACIAVIGFGAAVVTGLLLFTVQATRYAENPAFLAKFALLSLAGANAALFGLFMRVRKAAAALSLCVWCAVLLAGRWIAFADQL